MALIARFLFMLKNRSSCLSITIPVEKEREKQRTVVDAF